MYLARLAARHLIDLHVSIAGLLPWHVFLEAPILVQCKGVMCDNLPGACHENMSSITHNMFVVVTTIQYIHMTQHHFDDIVLNGQ